MRGFKIFTVLATLTIFSIVLGYLLFRYFNPKGAGISIQTNVPAAVFINGVLVGKTPYEAVRSPKDIVLKLVAQAQDFHFPPLETKVVLSSGIKTVVRQDFGASDEESATQIISFEKTGGPDPSLAVISIPDLSQISLDGVVMGFAPLKISKIREGNHQLVFSANGYKDVSVSVKAVVGYKLTVIIKLPKADIPTPTPEPKKETKTFIEILDTPVGFLRVREEPRVDAPEVARVKPGEKFPLIEEDKTSGWFKIEYLKGQAGWISNQYARKVEVEATSSPSPTY